MASRKEDVYATLLLTDSYLPGALVLAHSLRDAGTTKKLAVLVTMDTVSADAINQLRPLFDYVLPVERVVNSAPGNLFLMQRMDLHSVFTKITLWRQLQFRRIVYVDADIVALRAPDELFDLPHPFSAAPDIGWPDLFNTGLMVLKPNMGDYYALLAMAQRSISFDGADQGLLNMHFGNTFNRLSFSYNVTPSAHYQYLPAYRHFQSSISMIHFIGDQKPWNLGREAIKGATPYCEAIGRWWSVYDRHFRSSSQDPQSRQVPPFIQSLVRGESQIERSVSSGGFEPAEAQNAVDTGIVGQSNQETQEPTSAREEVQIPSQTNSQKEKEQKYTSWDASRAPPPTDSAPEASNFPKAHYGMSSDPTPFIPPKQYPEPPKNMYYEVPKSPPTKKLTPIFPWEKDATPAVRVWPEDYIEMRRPSRPKATEAASGSNSPEADDETSPSPESPSPEASSPWSSFSSRNVWDDIPQIQRYVQKLSRPRRGKIEILSNLTPEAGQITSPTETRRFMKLTDFPTEIERPSLPVTPAPIRKPVFWGSERDASGDLPAAEGVPSQADWDPTARLAQLARHQAEVLAQKLGDNSPTREIPNRSLPFGSEGFVSPTYVAPHRAKEPRETSSSTSTSTPHTISEPSFRGPGAAWEKGEDAISSRPPMATTDREVLET